MKESHPVEMAEFATAKGIEGEPAFCWWVPYILQKRDGIVAAIGVRLKKLHTSMGSRFQRMSITHGNWTKGMETPCGWTRM